MNNVAVMLTFSKLLPFLWLLLIFVVSWWGRGLLFWLKEQKLPLSMSHLLVVFSLLFLLVLLSKIKVNLKNFVLGSVFFVLAYVSILIPEEVSHLFLFGSLAILCRASSWKRGHSLVIGVLGAMSDEGIQAVHPERYFDMRDIGLNLLGFFSMYLAFLDSKIKNKILYLLPFFFMSCSKPNIIYHEKENFFSVLDVGEGLSVLVHSEGKSILIDTGSFASAEKVVRELRSHRIARLDALWLTHLHMDHASGFFRIYEEFNPEAIYESCQLGLDSIQVEDGIRWVREKLNTLKNRVCVQKGVQKKYGNLLVRVQWPQQTRPKGDLNFNSLVLELMHPDFHAWIMGDVPREVEEKIANTLNEESKTHVLVASHHGSKYSMSKIFLEKVTPKSVVISVNTKNKRGYPDQSIVRAYKGSVQYVWDTSKKGSYIVRY